jgi:glycosyltransferase involved in cell wall biosynthesis
MCAGFHSVEGGEDGLVSIITATRNDAPTLPTAIRSVKRQTYQKIEHIVIDGLSTDGTARVLDEYKQNRKGKVVILREHDNGMYDAINKGLALARGQIVGILNADDFYCDDALENVIGCFERTGTDIVYGNIARIPMPQEHQRLNEIVSDEKELNVRMSIAHPGVFVGRPIYERFGYFDRRYRIAADYELLLRLRAAGVAMAHLDRVVCNFRSGGMSERRLWRVAYETFLIQKRYFGPLHAGRILFRRAIEYSLIRWVSRACGAKDLTRW